MASLLLFEASSIHQRRFSLGEGLPFQVDPNVRALRWPLGLRGSCELELCPAMDAELACPGQPWPGSSGVGKAMCWQLMQHLDSWHLSWEAGMGGRLSILGETVIFDSVLQPAIELRRDAIPGTPAECPNYERQLLLKHINSELSTL